MEKLAPINGTILTLKNASLCELHADGLTLSLESRYCVYFKSFVMRVSPLNL